jgi:hypothetical protein
MTETNAPAPATEAPTIESTNAPAAPARAPSFADIVAARRNAANTNAQPPVTEAPKTEAPAPAAPAAKSVEVDIDEKALDQFVGLTKELRNTRAKAKELEAKAEITAKAEKFAALLAEGKTLEAFELYGADVFDKATQQALGVKPSAPDPLQQVQTELEKLKSDAAAKDAKAEADKKAAEEAQVEANRGKVVAEVTAHADAFPFLAAKPEKIREALKEADNVYEQLTKEYKRELTAAEKDGIIRAAIEEGEHQLAKLHEELTTAASRRKAPAGGAPASSAPTTFSGDMRGGGTNPTAPTKKLTFEEVRKQRKAA